MSKTAKLITTLIAATLALLLAGCRIDLPEIQEARIVNYANAQQELAPDRQLNRSEQAELQKWFSAHPNGWRRSFIGYAPEYRINIELKDGAQACVTIWHHTGPIKITVNHARHYYEKKLTADQAAELLRRVGENLLNEPAWDRD